MKTAIIYTVLSLIDLIAFVAGVAALPAEVPIHFNGQMIADAIGSPWVFVAFPGAAALISIGLFAALTLKKNRPVTMGLLGAAGIALVTIGWTFFALAASGAGAGERARFPFALVIGLLISLLLTAVGTVLFGLAPGRSIGLRARVMPKSEELRKKVIRFGGGAFFGSGLLAAVCSVLFGCIGALLSVQYVVAIVLCGLVLLSTGLSFLYAHLLSKREETAPSA